MQGLTWLSWIGLALFIAIQPVPGVSAEDQFTDRTPPRVTGIPDDELDAQRGGDVIPVSEATLNATLDGNRITSSLTGTNSVGGSAFTGASGFFTVIQNSGNQVIIQDSTIVNLTVE
jgi:hypothetical protein